MSGTTQPWRASSRRLRPPAKPTGHATRIALGAQDRLYLGNLNALRDWGYARDYVEAQWLILQQPMPEDFVIAMGEQRSVRESVTHAAATPGITIGWSGQGRDETGVIEKIDGDIVTSKLKAGHTMVRVDPTYFRPVWSRCKATPARRARN